ATTSSSPVSQPISPKPITLVEFKEKLYAGVELATEDFLRWPPGYNGMPRVHGKIKDLTRFDANFFSTYPKQANVMDPQLRLLLETSYEAILDAGYDPETFRKRKIGVFIGNSVAESGEAFKLDNARGDAFTILGCHRAMFSNRISYSLDLQGPSMTIDTACSSTMTALSEALLAIRSGRCEAAIVGGASVTLDPHFMKNFQTLGVLSSDGKCRPFDIDGGGYVRSEAVGAFFLQKFSDARRVYARVVNASTNADGYKELGVPYPSSVGHEKLLRDSYAEVNVDPTKVVYVEAHGTGTKVGGTQELEAISNVLCTPEREKPLLIGSVKSNMGHSESASGIPAVAKVILAMETGAITPTLHFTAPHPDMLSLCDGRVKVVDKTMPFDGGMRTLDRVEAEGPYPDSAYALLNRIGQRSVKLFPYRGYAIVPVDGVNKDVALVDMLQALGIQPDGMFGHSVGEIGCAYADGGFTAEQVLLCAYWRGRCLEMGYAFDGAMAAVSPGKRRSNAVPPNVYPACYNAHDSVTVSGTAEAVEKMVEQLQTENIFARKVIPQPKARTKRWISTSMPESRWEEPGVQLCSAEYHTNNFLNPVLFCEAIKHVPENAILLEIGPHCLLQSWHVAKWDDFPMPDEGKEDIVEVDIEGRAEDQYLVGHQPDGRIVFPGSGYLYLTWRFLANHYGKDVNQTPAIMDDVKMKRFTILPPTGGVRFQITVMPISGEFQVCEGRAVVCKGRIRLAEEGETVLMRDPPGKPREPVEFDMNCADIYKDLSLRGYQYYGAFQGTLKASSQKPYAKVKWDGNWVAFMDTVMHTSFIWKPELDLIYNTHHNLRRAGGVEVQGAKVNTVQRRPTPHAPIIEEHRFVPYIDNEIARRDREALLREYADVCNCISRRVQKLSEQKNSHFDTTSNGSMELPEELLNRYVENIEPNQSLLQLLVTTEKQAHDAATLASTLQSALLSTTNVLHEDILNTALLEGDPLRDIIDVVVENTSSIKLSLLEIADDKSVAAMGPRVSALLSMYNVRLKTEYTVTSLNNVGLTSQQVPEGKPGGFTGGFIGFRRKTTRG
ncbi:hypothetical protein MTO96_030746, partial [Rhipicephalus appendiculatus]